VNRFQPVVRFYNQTGGNVGTSCKELHRKNGSVYKFGEAAACRHVGASAYPMVRAWAASVVMVIIGSMSDKSRHEAPASDESASETESGSETRAVSRQPVSLPRTPSRWIAPIALLIAAIAVALAAWALLRPPANAAHAPTAAQSADAKARACSAFKTVATAVSRQTHADLGPDQVAQAAVAANARESMAVGASYLLAKTDPDTPADLAAVMRSFATNLQDISMNALAGLPNQDPVQAGRLHDAQSDSDRIAQMCK